MAVSNGPPAWVRLGLDGPRDSKPTHGIDVEALERAVDEVESLVRSEELRLLAVRTRDAALAADRARLDAKWTWWGSRPHEDDHGDDYYNRLLGEDW